MGLVMSIADHVVALNFGRKLAEGTPAQVQADLQAGQKAGVSGTPAFFVNGRFISGAAAFETFAEIINDELKRKG